jgi:WD40 repeat protein
MMKADMTCRRFLRAALALLTLWAAPALAEPPARGPEIVPQLGHTGRILGVAFSPDGKLVATASVDHTAALWSAETGAMLRRLEGHANAVGSVAFSPDGKQVLTGSVDNTAVLWETATGKAVRTFRGPETTPPLFGLGQVLAMDALLRSPAAFSPDGTQIATGFETGEVVLWDAATGRKVRTFKDVLNLRPTALGLSRDGKQLFTVWGGGLVGLSRWDVVTGKELQDLEGKAGVRTGAFSPDGKQLVTGSDNGSVALWSAATGTLTRRLEQHSEKMDAVAFSPDGKRLVGVDAERHAVLWDVAAGKKVKAAIKENVDAACFSPDGKQLLLANVAEAVLWDITAEKAVRRFQSHAHPVAAAVYSPDGGTILGAAGKANAFLWDLSSSRGPRALTGHTGPVAAVAFSADSKQALTGAADSLAILWDVATGAKVQQFKGHTKTVGAVAIRPDGKQVATGSEDKTAVLWNATTGRRVRTLKEHPDPVEAVAFSPDGKLLLTAVGKLKPVATLWDAATGAEVRSFRPNEDTHLGSDLTETVFGTPLSRVFNHLSWSAALSPDGSAVLTGGEESTAILWNARTGDKLLAFPKRTTWVRAAAFSPDGKQVLTGANDRAVQLWSVTTGRSLRSFVGHSQPVTAVAFRPDGKQIMTASADGTVRLWDPATGKELCALISIDDGTDWLVVTPEGFFDGSRGGREKVSFRVGGGLTVLPVDRFLTDYWQPGLLAKLLAGARLLPRRDFPAAAPPTLRFLRPSGPVKTDQEYLTVEVEATDEGGGIDGPFLHHQGTRLRQHQGEEKLGNRVRRTFRVRLVEGPNRLTVKAASRDRVESNPVSLTVVYDKPLVQSDLWVVAAGVSKYAQKDAELRFAAADAGALLKLFTDQHKPLYAVVHGTLLLDGQATADGLRKALKAARAAHPRDTFVLFLSGHGASVSGRYYFLPQEFRTEPGRSQEDDVRTQGIPADELADLLGQIPALKKVLILDTCNAGAAVGVLEKLRGKDDPGRLKREVERLYRAEGLFTIAAAADKEEAKEPRELGHGVLTYTLLAAFAAVDRGPLKGERLRPSGGDVVDVDEWFKYASRRMPDVMRAYFNRDQQPVISTERAGGFPILPAPKP